MKRLRTISILIVLLILIGLSVVVYFLYFPRTVVIQSGETVSKNLMLGKRNVLIEKNGVLNGNIELEKGEVTLQEGAKVAGSIRVRSGEMVLGPKSELTGDLMLEKGRVTLHSFSQSQGDLRLQKGDMILGEGVVIKGDILLKEGRLRLEKQSFVEGDVQIKKGFLEKHSSAQIQGQKPAVYTTYDWPRALRYFDVLPEAHKEAVGFIFLTQGSNAHILDPNVQRPRDYFAGIYDYGGGKLIAMDPRNEEQMKVFFEKAKTFFQSIPERRLGVYGIGAATKNFAHSEAFADIYLPANGSDTLVIHEMGHVMDFKHDFTDFHDPLYPWTQEDGVSSYGQTHPGEDFAEAYRLYILTPENFKELIQEMPERQKKYDFLEEFVF